MNKNTPIFIHSAQRTPIGKYGGYFKDTSATTLGSTAIASVIQHADEFKDTIQQVIMGCVLPAGLGQAPARQAALGAGVDHSVPCVTVNKICGSGMQAVIQACESIRAGSLNTAIAGGMENMTLAPQCIRANGSEFSHMMLDGLEDAYQKGKPMGYFAEKIAQQLGFSRLNQDNYATSSLRRAQDAMEKGYFTTEIATMLLDGRNIDRDEGPLTLNPEKIPTLKPIFKEDGTITAANASSISDGAAALLLTNKPDNAIAKISHYTTYAAKPSDFPTAPIFAIEHLLKDLNWSVSDVDLFEINEAFAVVPMAAMQALKIPREKVNIHGGACALGHPIGASGARILVTLAHALEQRSLKRGIASLCIGGGEAQAIAIALT